MLKLSLRGNRVVSIEVLPVRRLTTRDAVREKFRRCEERALPPSSMELAEKQILRLEEQCDVQFLMTAVGTPIEPTDFGLHAS
jgi:hypothetical protein